MDASDDISYRAYTGEQDLPQVMDLVSSELSEPYVIYTFRYFLCQWPHLAFLAYSSRSPTPVGVIISKQSMHRHKYNRGYIAMLSVDKAFRKRGIGMYLYRHSSSSSQISYVRINPPFHQMMASALVRNSMEAMKEDGVDEIVLETEYDNHVALSLYESLGFIREKRLYRFYLNGKDAFRLILTVPPPPLLEHDSEDGSSSGGSTISGVVKRRGGLGPGTYRAIRVSPYSDEEDEDEYLSRR
ncbi:hypothetical protein D9757_007594 [Collybiopsis confluens]|uniref:N-acetyltransferase domain-containing protein n=1 Tax=Collybiopsis confluens TaxID=2823264 RepID=A0A8H5M5S1_9AGAR|nr:hypothetical protein D9757_007594 [Collybiopsis confluens]